MTATSTLSHPSFAPTPPAETISWIELDSPVGTLVLVGNDEVITGLHFGDRLPTDLRQQVPRQPQAASLELSRQLDSYFRGELSQFDLLLAPKGTTFQLAVWRALTAIPYGTTISYSQLAANIDQPRAHRAAGSANGRNPISIVIPCHRVIAADGSLGGYGGGLERKSALLETEKAKDGDFSP